MSELQKFSSNDPRWLSLIEQDPAATIFHHPAWMELLNASYDYQHFIFALPDMDGQLYAGLPIAEINDHLTARRYVALPFSDYCAPLCRDEGSLSCLTESLLAMYKAGQCPKLEVRASLAPSPYLMDLEVVLPYVLHTVSLDGGEARVAKNIHRTQMQNVRTAEKNGIRVVRGYGIDEVRAFYRLHWLNRRKHGVPVQPWHFFELFTRSLLDKGLGFVQLAYLNDECISGGIFLHWQKTLTYKYSATDESKANLRPNHLVTWTAMQWGMEHGYTAFDFGRADLEDEGLRTYKRRWGAVETPLFYSYCPSAPAAHKNGRLSHLMKTVIQRSPLWVCKAAGTLFYRFVG